MKTNKLNESLDTSKKQLKESNDDEFFEIQDIVSAALNSIGGDMDDVTGGITSSYDEDRLLLSLYSTVDRKDARKFKKNFLTTIESALSQTRFSEVSYDENHTYAYQLSRNDIFNMLGSDRADDFMSKFAMFEICITAYGKKLEEDMIIGYDEGSIKEQIRILEKNIEDYKQLIIDEPEDKDYWEEQIKKCEEEIADLQSYKPLDEAKVFGAKGKKLNEASYGGAFDIADDQYFNKEEIVEFGEDVVDSINNIGYSKVSFVSAYVENGCIEVTAEFDGGEATASTKIDMRKIRKPSDLYKACGKIIIDKLMKELADIGADMGPHMSDQDYPMNEGNEILPIEELNSDGTPKQHDVKFMELEKVPGLLNWDVADQLEKHFRDNKLWVDELYYNEVKDCIEYDINWGDWKHEHLRSKWLLEELFEKLGIVASINSHTTEEDGSDTYSAHYVVRATGKMNEAITPPTGDDPDLSEIPQIGQEVMYRGKRTTIIDYEQDPEYGYDFLIKNPFWNGEDERFENIWVGDQVDFIDWGPNDIGLQPPG